MLSDERLVDAFEEHFLAIYEPTDLADIVAGLRAVEAAVRADMQPREVRTVEYRAVAMYPDTKDVVDSAAVAPSVEDALNSAEVFGLAESNADIPNLIIGVEQRTKAGPWLPVTPSTPNQRGAEL